MSHLPLIALSLTLLLAGCTPGRAVLTPPPSSDGGQASDGGATTRDGGATTRDAGSCEDTLNDPLNCGTCGHRCDGQCVAGECVDRADCLITGCPGAAWCDAATGVCRAGCAEDAACGDGRLCDPSTHRCRPAPANCLVSACPVGHVCDLQSGLCRTGCDTQGDCPASAACTDGACVARPISCARTDCPIGRYCETESMTCQSGCDERSPCANGGACNPVTHVCGTRPMHASCLTTPCTTGNYCEWATGQCRPGCDATASCPADRYCNLDTHACEFPPTTCPAGACPLGTQCAAGVCVPGCQSSSDCGERAFCDLTIHQCRAAPPNCALQGCPAGQFCDARTLTCTAGCSRDSDCPDGSNCDATSARCLPAPAGCQPGDCAFNETCDPGDGRCKTTCTSTATCGGSASCSGGVCESTCSAQTCRSGRYCSAEGSCLTGCSGAEFPCPTGQSCNAATHTCATVVDPCATSCAPGTYCDTSTGGQCVPGCDARHPCPEEQVCNPTIHTCLTQDSCELGGLTRCAGACVETASDTTNCGACGITCGVGGSCVEGECLCPGSQQVCGESCVDTTSNATHCGDCETACSTNNGTPACSAGQCSISCDSGFGNCDGSASNGCEASFSEPTHCGTCGTRCALNASCSGGCTCNSGWQGTGLSCGSPTAQYGSPSGGGSAWDICPQGQVVVGYQLWNWNVNHTMNALRAICGTVHISGAPPVASISSGATLNGLMGAHLDNAATGTRLCPADQVMIGFGGRCGTLVDQLIIRCAPITFTSNGSEYSVDRGGISAQSAFGGNGGGSFPDTDCPAGSAIVGTNVRMGDLIDAVGFLCAPIDMSWQ